MRTIYLDSEFICHAENEDGRKAIETDALDYVCDSALEFYKFFPAHDGKVDIVQCFDSRVADSVQKAVDYTKAQTQNMIDEYEQALTEIEKALGVTSE